jgi:hypothetical protein
VAPIDFVEDGVMLHDQRGVEEQPLGEGRLCSTDSFPVGWAEVGVKREAYLKEQVVRKDIRKGACHIGVMLDLVEARLDIIGVDDDVVIRIRQAKVVCTDQDRFAHQAELANELGAVWSGCHAIYRH